MERLELITGLIMDLKRGLDKYPENFNIPKTQARIKQLEAELKSLTHSVNVCYNGNKNLH